MLSKEQRKTIERFVLNSRKLLEEEFDKLLRVYGLMPDKKLPAEKLSSEKKHTRETIEVILNRESEKYKEARRRYIKNATFTFLNKILALRISEVYGLIDETVITRSDYGNRSKRERDLLDSHPELASKPEELASRALEDSFEEMSKHIPYLFTTNDPYSILTPSLITFRELRKIVAELPDDVLKQFETIGWTYQYFNNEEREEIRKRMKGSPNPDDVPPINQFYTVGWIVKFLVENTVGKLADLNSEKNLDYLVQSNTLNPPGSKVEDIKVLDPACGSGHFLLGAFDTLMDIWVKEHPEIPKSQIPALILEKNLYGIDIDLRAVQLAAMALYLKARTTFEQLKEDGEEFELKRINVVCADIHFVDGERRKDFLYQFEYDENVRKIVEETIRACESAYNIGSLLKIRKPFEKLFQSRGKKRWDKADFVQTQLKKFAPEAMPKEYTVEEIVNKIKDFVREASHSKDMGTVLFGLDAERAISLVDVLTDYYDVVLMNPPYGAMPKECKDYAKKHYTAYADYYTAFIEQAIDLCKPGGFVGALTGRTFMFLKSHQKLREEVLRFDGLPELVLDLGFNVLDGATARYAALTVRKRYDGDGINWEEHPVTFFRLTEYEWDDKRVKFEESLNELREENGWSTAET